MFTSRRALCFSPCVLLVAALFDEDQDLLQLFEVDATVFPFDPGAARSTEPLSHGEAVRRVCTFWTSRCVVVKKCLIWAVE